MEGLWIVLGVVAGLIAGAAVCSLTMKNRVADLQGRLSQAETDLRDAASRAQTAETERAAAVARAERIPQLESDVESLRTDIAAKVSEITSLKEYIAGEESRAAERADQHEEKVQQLTELREEFAKTFENLSNSALDQTRTKFFEEAENLLKNFRTTANDDMEAKRKAIQDLIEPVNEQLKSLDELTAAIEKTRNQAHGELKEQLSTLKLQQSSLEQETTRLVKALQDPGTAGSWGEMVLERVLEMAGLEEHWSYATQQTSDTEDGRQRPDVVINLPGQRTIVIDSKAPLRAYLDGLGTDDTTARNNLMAVHANKMLEHAKVLSKRDYARRDDTLDFTVLFVPSEAAFRSACESRPNLIEESVNLNVFIATPTTLLALLRAVTYGWRQEKLAQEAQKVQVDGRKLYEAVVTMVDHYVKMGRSLKSATDHYNNFGGSLEFNVLPAARRFKEAGVATQKSIPDVSQVEFTPRSVAKAAAEVASLPGFEEFAEAKAKKPSKSED